MQDLPRTSEGIILPCFGLMAHVYFPEKKLYYQAIVMDDSDCLNAYLYVLKEDDFSEKLEAVPHYSLIQKESDHPCFWSWPHEMNQVSENPKA